MVRKDENFEMFSGDDTTLTVTVVDQDGNVVDLTGATIKYQILNSVTSDSAQVTKDNGGTGGVTITDAANGEYEVSITASDTSSLSGEFYHESEVTDSGGDVSTVFSGTVTIIRDAI